MNETKSRAIELRQRHKDWTLKQIGNQLGVTKQRVFAILKLAELPTRSLRLLKQLKRKICPICFAPTPGNQKICPGKCKETFFFVHLKCDFCNSPIRMAKTTYQNRLTQGQKFFYCNNSCKGRGLNLQHARKVK